METLEYKNHQGQDKRITLIKEIGKGAFGTVYESLLEGYGLVAVKSQKAEEKILEELEVESRLIPILQKYAILLKKILLNPVHKDDKNITAIPELHVSFSESIDEDKVYSVYELVDGLSLQKIIDLNKETKSRISKSVLNRYINDLFQGVLEMQNADVVHRDIKPANIMLSRGTLKYIDFGLTCFKKDCTGTKGTPNYVAPEFYKKNPIDWNAIDIFALGVTIMVMITGVTLWKSASFRNYRDIVNFCAINPYNNIDAVFARSIITTFRKFPEYEQYMSLVIGMTRPNPKERATIRQCIRFLEKLQEEKFITEV